jgi:hypothetical protein
METQQEEINEVELGALLDAWRLRFGTRWVKADELDSFFKETVLKLNKAFYIEAHGSWDNHLFKLTYRLVERE